MITRLLGLEDLGIYSSAFRIAGVGGMIAIGFQFALAPYIYQRYDEPETPQNIANLFRFVLTLSFSILLFLGLFAEEIISRFVGADYGKSAVLFFPLAIATCLMQLLIFAPGLGIQKKTWQIFFIYTLGVIINTVLNFILIPLFDLWGAVLSTLISSFFNFALMLFFSHKNYPIPYQFKAYVLCTIYVFIAYTGSLFLSFEGIIEWVIKFIFWVGIILCCVLTKLVRIQDIQVLQQQIAARLYKKLG